MRELPKDLLKELESLEVEAAPTSEDEIETALNVINW